MKIKVILTAFAVCMICTSNFAQQESTTSKSRIYVGDTYVGVGGYTIYNIQGSVSHAEALTPDDFDANKIAQNSYTSSNLTSTSGSFSMALGINFRNKDGNDRKQFQLRAGISYMNGMGSSATWYDEEILSTDTLVAQGSGAQYSVDSIVSTNYGYNYEYDQIRLDFSAIFRTNQLSRWSAFAGVGFSAGVSVKANTRINYNRFNSVRVQNTSFNGPPVQNFENKLDFDESEVVNNKTVLGGLVYTTLGIDFRLAKSHAFWSKFNLGYEIRPGINIIQSPEIGTISNPALSNSLTLRISV